MKSKSPLYIFISLFFIFISTSALSETVSTVSPNPGLVGGNFTFRLQTHLLKEDFVFDLELGDGGGGWLSQGVMPLSEVGYLFTRQIFKPGIRLYRYAVYDKNNGDFIGYIGEFTYEVLESGVTTQSGVSTESVNEGTTGTTLEPSPPPSGGPGFEEGASDGGGNGTPEPASGTRNEDKSDLILNVEEISNSSNSVTYNFTIKNIGNKSANFNDGNHNGVRVHIFSSANTLNSSSINILDNLPVQGIMGAFPASIIELKPNESYSFNFELSSFSAGEDLYYHFIVNLDYFSDESNYSNNAVFNIKVNKFIDNTPPSIFNFPDDVLNKCLDSKGYTDVNDIKSLTLDCQSIGIISSIEGIQSFKNLIFIDLHNNNISDLSPMVDIFKSSNNFDFVFGINPIQNYYRIGELELGNLDLSNKNISDISFISNISELEILNISNNNITDITSLFNLRYLGDVDLRGNNVSCSDINKLKETVSIVRSDFCEDTSEPTPLPLASPNLTITPNPAIVGENVTLSLTEVNDATIYKLYYGFVSGNYTETLEIESIFDFKMPEGLDVYAVVTAINGDVESPLSNEIHLQTKESEVEAPVVIREDNSLNVEFVDSSGLLCKFNTVSPTPPCLYHYFEVEQKVSLKFKAIGRDFEKIQFFWYGDDEGFSELKNVSEGQTVEFDYSYHVDDLFNYYDESKGKYTRDITPKALLFSKNGQRWIDFGQSFPLVSSFVDVNPELVDDTLPTLELISIEGIKNGSLPATNLLTIKLKASGNNLDRIDVDWFGDGSDVSSLHAIDGKVIEFTYIYPETDLAGYFDSSVGFSRKNITLTATAYGDSEDIRSEKLISNFTVYNYTEWLAKSFSLEAKPYYDTPYILNDTDNPLFIETQWISPSGKVLDNVSIRFKIKGSSDWVYETPMDVNPDDSNKYSFYFTGADPFLVNAYDFQLKAIGHYTTATSSETTTGWIDGGVISIISAIPEVSVDTPTGNFSLQKIEYKNPYVINNADSFSLNTWWTSPVGKVIDSVSVRFRIKGTKNWIVETLMDLDSNAPDRYEFIFSGKEHSLVNNYEFQVKADGYYTADHSRKTSSGWINDGFISIVFDTPETPNKPTPVANPEDTILPDTYEDCMKQYGQYGAGSVSEVEQRNLYLRCISDKTVNDGASLKERWLSASEESFNAFTGEIYSSAVKAQHSFSIIFNPDTPGLEKIENATRGIYQVSLGTIKAFYGAIGGFAYGSFKDEMNEISSQIADVTEDTFHSLSKNDQDIVLDLVSNGIQLINSNEEIKSAWELSGYASIPSLKPLTKIFGKTTKIKVEKLEKQKITANKIKFRELKEISPTSNNYFTKKDIDKYAIKISNSEISEGNINYLFNNIIKNGDNGNVDGLKPGDKTESLSHMFFQNSDYRSYDVQYTAVPKFGKINGIDGLYIKYNIDKIEEILIVESKQRVDGKGIKLSDKQMTNDWIINSLKLHIKEMNEVVPLEIGRLPQMIEDNSEVITKLIFAVDRSSANINIFKIK